MRFIFLTMDGNHAAALREAAALLRRDQGVELGLGLYDACSLRDEADWRRLAEDVRRADFVFGSMLFGEDLVRPLERALEGATCPVCVITSNPALIYRTRLGKFELHARDEQDASPIMQWARKFRPKKGAGEGHRQLALLRNLGKILKLLPGRARDLHTYIAVHQYWMHCSAENLRRMLCLLIERYVPGYKGRLAAQDPIEYPDLALFHPDAPAPFATLDAYRRWQNTRRPAPAGTPRGVVGLLSLRTVALSGNTAHLRALVHALEARGLEVRMAYSAGLDMRPAIDAFFSAPADTRADGHRSRSKPQAPSPKPQASVDVLLNGAGFSLVGGMAESRPEEARIALERLGVSYFDMIPLAFQRVEEWRRDDTGLSPIQTAMNVAIPELDAAIEPLVFGGPTAESDTFVALPDQIERAADRIAKRATLRRKPNAEKRLAIVLFNFPPNLGNAGTAAYLDVFASLHRLLLALRAAGYPVEVPADAEELRRLVVEGNAMAHGTDGNVGARLPLADYRRLCPDYADIEPFWGLAPGELLNDGRSFYILGAQLGGVFVGMQPSFGYERDPMRLLMAKDAAPHHGFAAFYTWIEHVFGADAVLHFGTHGALEFMPGKQTGLSSACWPARLLGALPNLYYYSVNNPSEATIAKRRGAATLVSYMVPPLQQAGLYKGLRLLKDSIDTYRQHPGAQLLADIRAQAERLGLGAEAAALVDELYVAALAHELLLVEQRMIPMGLHVLGETAAAEELADVLALVANFHKLHDERGALKHGRRPGGRFARLPACFTLPQLLAAEQGWDYEADRAALKTDRAAQERWEWIEAEVKELMRAFVAERAESGEPRTARREPGVAEVLAPLWAHLDDLLGRMREEREVAGLLDALAGCYIPPSPGNDVVRNPAVVPTGRNIHGLDPFRVPTLAAQDAGERLVAQLLERLAREGGAPPETIALVLWGTDNLKSDGEGVAQALALLGARAVADELGKISDVELIPLKDLGRPRVDVVITVSGIFRDLLHHQMGLLDKAARLAAAADEPLEFNHVRRHALAQAAELHITLDEAATRVFANAPGSYGANVNHLVESSNWEEDGQLSEAFLGRKSYAYGQRGTWREARAVMESALATVDATFQNIDSFEVGISDIDHYYENLGGITKSVERLRGVRPAVMVADALATASGRLSSLEQMVRLESRAKLLNPKWFEAMLKHGYEGVREIETRVGNTYGWSATTGAVEGWVYQGVAETFLLDEAMRERMARLNAHATASVARRLLEASSRGFWDADDQTLAALQQIYADLEDRLEGIQQSVGG
ncbi:MAG TPA: magnesium chelatase subunit H [Roseiflexaceae bacterium]|nr:magnesium chelatase subunit H [Roseiflexaceae bacterium]